MEFKLGLEESPYWARERQDQEKTLDEVVTPVIDHQEDPCMICFEEFGQPLEDGTPGEQAVRLPCNHVYGSDCLTQWVRNWTPGSQGSVCTLCRENFGVTGVAEPLSDPSTTGWVHRLREAYEEEIGVAPAGEDLITTLSRPQTRFVTPARRYGRDFW